MARIRTWQETGGAVGHRLGWKCSSKINSNKLQTPLAPLNFIVNYVMLCVCVRVCVWDQGACVCVCLGSGCVPRALKWPEVTVVRPKSHSVLTIWPRGTSSWWPQPWRKVVKMSNGTQPPLHSPQIHCSSFLSPVTGYCESRWCQLNGSTCLDFLTSCNLLNFELVLLSLVAKGSAQ